MKVSIIIPAYNEELRIRKTLVTYHEFFQSKQYAVELLVVLNGCIDNTRSVVEAVQKECSSIRMIGIKSAGKGLAIKTGFLDALSRDNDLIGYVDADMATTPFYFAQLIEHIDSADGIIASRYMLGAHVTPERPRIKRWGSKLIYEPLIRILFHISYYDYQCGAKLFKRHVIEKVASLLTVTQWAFDVELLYLCKKYGFTIKEVPTVWHDQSNSKLKIMRSGMRMLATLISLRLLYAKSRMTE